MRRGYVLSAGGKCLNRPGDERSEARWESGLEQLEKCGFVKDASYEGEVFRLTKEGFDAADQLWYVLILRRIESLQSHEHSYVNYADIINEPVFGQKSVTRSCGKNFSHWPQWNNWKSSRSMVVSEPQVSMTLVARRCVSIVSWSLQSLRAKTTEQLRD